MLIMFHAASHSASYFYKLSKAISKVKVLSETETGGAYASYAAPLLSCSSLQSAAILCMLRYNYIVNLN